MKKLIIILIVVFKCTILSQNWTRVEYDATKYYGFQESENYIVSQSNIGIHFSKKDKINFDKVLEYPKDIKISAQNYSVFSVYNDTTVFIVFDIIPDGISTNKKVALKSTNQLSGWEELPINFDEVSNYLNRIDMLDDTTFIGYIAFRNPHYYHDTIYKFSLRNNKWEKSILFIGSDNGNVAQDGLNIRNSNELICLKDNDGYVFKVYLHQNRIDTIDYKIFYLEKDKFYDAIQSFSDKDTTYYFSSEYNGVTEKVYLLKVINDKIVSKVSQLAIEAPLISYTYITYLYSGNGVFVVIDLLEHRLMYSTNYGKDWKEDIEIPSTIFFKAGYETSVSSYLTSNNILFICESGTDTQTKNGYYLYLKPVTNVEIEENNTYITQSTHLELFDILGRSIATFPSYEKLKAEIENYPLPHLIKWRDEKGISHFEKMK